MWGGGELCRETGRYTHRTDCQASPFVTVSITPDEEALSSNPVCEYEFGKTNRQKLRYCMLGLQFYTFFGISIGIKRRFIDIAKKITFYFLQNV
jgi:hypothetical protein